ARWEADHEEDHILDLRLHEARAGGLDPRRLLVEPVQRDRDVVRTEVPQDVDVELVEPEVDALAVDVLDAPDAALGQDLLPRAEDGDAQVALGHSSFRMTAHPSPSRSFVKPAFSYMLSGPW